MAKTTDRPATRLGSVALLVIAACVAAGGARAASNYKVLVTGLSGPVEENVEAILDPSRSSSRKGGLNEAEVRRMHEQAPQLIRTALQPYGYYRPTITSELVQTKGGWEGRYAIVPGPPIALDSVVVEVNGPGATDPEIQKAESQFPLHKGGVLVHASYDKGKLLIEQAAAHRGYIDAAWRQNEMRVDLAHYTAAIVLRYDTGQQYKFGDVVFNETIINPRFLRGYANFRPGDPLDLTKLLTFQAALGESPYFSGVQVEPLRDAARDDVVPIQVTLEPARREHYRAGLGYGTDNGVHARGQLEIRRLNARGHRAELDVLSSRPETSGQLNYYVPWPYPATDIVTVGLAAGQERVANTLGRRASIGVAWSRMLGQWRRGLELRYQRERFVVSTDSGTVGTLEPDMSWSWTHADDRLFTRNGARILTDTRLTSSSVLSDVTYTQLDVSAKWIRGITPRNRLIVRMEVGSTFTNDFHRLPRSRRYFAGGAESVRGYAYQSLGPHGTDGIILGGQDLEIGSVEVDQWLRNQPLGVAAFYDTGNALARFGGTLEQGAGLGVRWRSPVGLLRADFAMPLAGGRHRPVFHFQMGPEL